VERFIVASRSLRARPYAGAGRCRGSSHHDRPVRGAYHPSRDAPAEPPPPRAQYDQPRPTEACELDQSLGGPAIELLTAGRDTRLLGCGKRIAERSLRGGDLGVETTLIVRLSEKRGRATANVDEDDRRAKPAGQRDCRPGRRRAARGRVNCGNYRSVLAFPSPHRAAPR
jgi:hypothetical protein